MNCMYHMLDWMLWNLVLRYLCKIVKYITKLHKWTKDIVDILKQNILDYLNDNMLLG